MHEEFSIRETVEVSKYKADCALLTIDVTSEKLLHSQVWEHNLPKIIEPGITLTVKCVTGIKIHKEFAPDVCSYKSSPLPLQKNRRNTNEVVGKCIQKNK